jgi:hypothetical protein
MAKNMLPVVLLVVGVALLVGGCASNGPCPAAAAGALAVDASRQVVNGHNYYDTVLDSRDERWNRYNLIRDIEDREFQDDLDYFLLLNHNSRMTEWHPDTGH